MLARFGTSPRPHVYPGAVISITHGISELFSPTRFAELASFHTYCIRPASTMIAHVSPAIVHGNTFIMIKSLDCYLRSYRRRWGLTQNELAILLGYRTATVV